MNLGEIRTEVRRHLKETTADVWLDAELNSLINRSCKFLVSLLHENYLKEMIQPGIVLVVASTVNYDLPTRFVRLVGSLFDTTNNEVYSFKPIAEVGQQRSGANTYMANTEKIVYIANNDFYIYPVPTGLATLNYFYLQHPDDMTVDGDESDIQDSLMDLVIFDVASKALLKARSETALALSANLRAQFDALLKQVNMAAQNGYAIWS